MMVNLRPNLVWIPPPTALPIRPPTQKEATAKPLLVIDYVSINQFKIKLIEYVTIRMWTLVNSQGRQGF